MILIVSYLPSGIPLKNRLIIKIHPPLFNNRGGLVFMLLFLMVRGGKMRAGCRKYLIFLWFAQIRYLHSDHIEYL